MIKNILESFILDENLGPLFSHIQYFMHGADID